MEATGSGRCRAWWLLPSMALLWGCRDAGAPTELARNPQALSYAITSVVGSGDGAIQCSSPISQGSMTICQVTPGVGYRFLSATCSAGLSCPSSSITGLSQFVVSNVQAAGTVTATFDPIPESVVARCNSIGFGTCDCTSPIAGGSNTLCTATSSLRGFRWNPSIQSNSGMGRIVGPASWSGDPVLGTLSWTASIGPVLADKNVVTSDFEQYSVAIVAGASLHGQIVCPSTVDSLQGGSCMVLPDPGYRLASVSCSRGVTCPSGPVVANSFDFSDAVGDAAAASPSSVITPVFELISGRAVTGISGGNGTFSCVSPVAAGEGTTCTATPAEGYRLASVTCSAGVTCPSSSVEGQTTVSIPTVTSDGTVTATFEAILISYNVTGVVSGVGGTFSCVSPVSSGSETTCMAAPEAGYRLASVTCSTGVTCPSSSVEGQTTVSIPTVTSDGTVTATFAPLPPPTRSYSVVGVVLGGHGSLSCDSPVPENSGSLCQAVPDPGYRLVQIGCSAGVTCPSDSVVGETSIALLRVTAPSLVTAVFAPIAEPELFCTGSGSCPGEQVCVDRGCRPKGGAGDRCVETADCAEEACVDSVCLPALHEGDRCGDDAGCPQGTRCVDRLCVVAPGEGGLCGTDENCAPSRTCLDNACRPKVDEGGRCDSDPDCLWGLSCIASVCRPWAEWGGACDSNPDCASPGTCIDGTCREASDLDGPCDDPGDCLSGVCIDEACAPPAASGERCEVSADCLSGLVCVSARCLPPVAPPSRCDRSPDCLGGLVCVGHACVAPVAESGACDSRENCVGGLVCLQGRCEPRSAGGGVCDEAADCTQGLRCEEGRCLPVESVPVPLCQGAKDCAFGETCVEGACRIAPFAGGSLSCGEGGGGSASLLALLVLGSLFWGMRRKGGRGTGLILALCAVAAIPPSRVNAEEARFELERFHPTMGRFDLLGVESARVAGHLEGTLQLFGSYAHEPLIQKTPEGRIPIIGGQWGGDLGVSLGLFDRAEVSLVLAGSGAPTVADMGHAVTESLARLSASARLTDLRLSPKLLLLQREAFHLGAAMPVEIPLGGGALLESKSVAVNPKLLLDYGRGFRMALDVGVLLRAGQDFGNPAYPAAEIRTGSTWTFGLGGEVPLRSGAHRLDLLATFKGEAGLRQRASNAQPMALMGALRWTTPVQLAVTLGGGVGVSEGYGAPAYRIIGGITFAPRGGETKPEPTPETAPPPAPIEWEPVVPPGVEPEFKPVSPVPLGAQL